MRSGSGTVRPLAAYASILPLTLGTMAIFALTTCGLSLQRPPAYPRIFCANERSQNFEVAEHAGHA